MESIMRSMPRLQRIKFNGEYTYLAFADDLIILSDQVSQDVIINMSSFSKKKMGLVVK